MHPKVSVGIPPVIISQTQQGMSRSISSENLPQISLDFFPEKLTGYSSGIYLDISLRISPSKSENLH